MTAVDTAPPLRIDRYLALLAILMALVLGLLVIGERQRPAPGLPSVEGTLPPAGQAVVPAATAAADRETLLAEQARLAARLDQTEQALRRAEAEIERLREANRALSERLEGEGAALDDLARRLAAVEADRDRLAAEVEGLVATRDGLETRLAELGERPSAPPAIAAAEPPGDVEAPRAPPRDPSATIAAQPRGLQAALEDMLREQRAGEAAIAPPDGERADVAPSTPGRMITFNGAGGTVADGTQAYNEGDYATAAQIWGALAASGDARAQFHFGALLFEGRTAEPDLVMAHVWLSRAVDGGHLPAIELRRRVRAAMSEAQYQEALAIQATS